MSRHQGSIDAGASGPVGIGPAIHFANQGSCGDILRTQHYLFTPKDGPWRQVMNYQAMGNMALGDKVIIKGDGGMLTGIATVLATYDDVPMARDFAERSKGWREGMLGRRLDVEYAPFNEGIPYRPYKDELLRAQDEGPPGTLKVFDKNGNAVMGTYFNLSAPLAKALMRVIGSQTPVGSASTSATESVPYVAKFSQQEVRPEQPAFRERMLCAWDGQCPITGTSNPDLLDAAHFEDWRYRNDDGAGMLLNTLIHRAVDREILSITLDSSGKTWKVEVLVQGDPILDGFDGLTFPNPLTTA